MYVTVYKKAGIGSDGGTFDPPAYVGSRLTEAIAAAIKIAKATNFAAVYALEEGKDIGTEPKEGFNPAFACWLLTADEMKFLFSGSDAVPIEFYKRGFPELDALYETQNPRP